MVEPGGRGGRGGKGSTGKGKGRGRGGEGSSNRVVTIFKPEQGTKSGIRLQGSDGPPTIVVLNPEGVAADVLVAGEQLLAVNGEVVTGHEAGTQMIKSAVGAAGRKCRHSSPFRLSSGSQRPDLLRAGVALGSLAQED